MAERPRSPLDRAFLSDHPSPTRLLLVRHGQQQFPDGDDATLGDWVDPPLSEIGRRQAEAVGVGLAGESIDAVYSSHLSRANDTGTAIAAHHGLEVTIDEDLREIEMFGQMDQSQRPADVIGERILQGARERFARTRDWSSYPLTESTSAFRHRVNNAIEGVLADHVGQTVVIACHGGVINAYMGEIVGIDDGMFFRPCHASTHRVLAGDDKRVLLSLNETHYLASVSEDLVTV